MEVPISNCKNWMGNLKLPNALKIFPHINTIILFNYIIFQYHFGRFMQLPSLTVTFYLQWLTFLRQF